jgi:hypothetical protein
MVPVADIVDVMHLEQLYRRQGDSHQAGCGNAQPPPSGPCLAGTEVGIKVIRTALAAPDLLDRHSTNPYSIGATDGTYGRRLAQRMQGVWVPGQRRPPSAQPGAPQNGTILFQGGDRYPGFTVLAAQQPVVDVLRWLHLKPQQGTLPSLPSHRIKSNCWSAGGSEASASELPLW